MVMTADEVRELREKNKAKRSRKWLKIEGDTTTYVRIGPPWKRLPNGEWGEIWKDAFFHGRYPNKLYCPQGVIDPKTHQPRVCPACRRLKELKLDKSAYGKRLYKLLFRKSEGLWNVLKLKWKEIEGAIKIIGRDGGWQIMRLSGSWHNELLDIFTESEYRKESAFGVSDLKFGRDVRIKRTGTDMEDTEYRFKAQTVARPAAPDKEQRLALRKTLINLDEAATLASKEELEVFVRRMEKKAKSQSDKDLGDKEEDENNATTQDPEEADTEEADGESEGDETGDTEGADEGTGDDESGGDGGGVDDEEIPSDDDSGDSGETDEADYLDEDQKILAEMKRGMAGKKPKPHNDDD